jgi:hypothetical protein
VVRKSKLGSIRGRFRRGQESLRSRNLQHSLESRLKDRFRIYTSLKELKHHSSPILLLIVSLWQPCPTYVTSFPLGLALVHVLKGYSSLQTSVPRIIEVFFVCFVSLKIQGRSVGLFCLRSVLVRFYHTLVCCSPSSVFLCFSSHLQFRRAFPPLLIVIYFW